MYYGIVQNLINDEFVVKQNLLLHVENFAKISIAICNIISANLLHIATCNKWHLIALHIYCNRPLIYWQRSEIRQF